MIIVTGGAGFIGSWITARLNEKGYEELLIVDHLEESDPKQRNLEGKKYAEYLDKGEFLQQIREERITKNVECLIHMGACSSTTLQDADYFQKNNFEYSCHLARWAVKRGVRFIYASSAATYGDGSLGYRDDEATIRKLKPLNLYGESKQRFDLWVLDSDLIEKVVGLKFFNVFGPNEYHKGEMRSVIAKAYQKAVDEGVIRLFKSYKPEYKDGEQKRDFIYVKDAVDIVMHFFENPDANGIYNVGTGQARTWNDVAAALFAAIARKPNIEYFDMPPEMRPRYQYFTEADMQKLTGSGFSKSPTPLEAAVKDYAGYLKRSACL